MSHSLLDQLKASITPQLIADAAKSIGESPDTTGQAINAALPALLTGVSAATRTPSGLSSVLRLVEDPANDGTLGTQLASLYQGTMSASPIFRLGSQLLNAIFGNRLTQVTQGIAALSGMRPASASALTGMLGAHVLSVLGASHRAVVDHTPDGFAQFVERQGSKLPGMLPPALAAILGSPATMATAATTKVTTAATAAATAATTVAAAAANALKPSATVTEIKPAIKNGAPTKAASPAPGLSTTKAAEPKKRAAAVVEEPVSKKSRAPLAWVLLGLGLGCYGLLWSQDRGHKLPPVDVATQPRSESTPASKLESVAAAPTPKPVDTVPAAADVKTAAATPAKPETKPEAKPDTKPIAAAPGAPAKPEAKPEAKPAAATTPAVVVPPDHLAVSPLGVTSFFGATPPVAESPARINPDYKPFADMPASPAAAPLAAATPIVIPDDKPAASPQGTTSFFGTIATALDLPASMNPDYKPAPAAVVLPPVVVPEDRHAASPPGINSYFGTTASKPEMPAIPNPDYKPVVAAAAPAAPAPVAAAPAVPTSGITTYFGTTPATPGGTVSSVPAITAVAGCQDKVTEAVKSGVVLFRSGRADLTPESLGTLKRIATAFKGCAGTKLHVDGHTDDTGSADFNARLSLARAKTVANYLLTRNIELARLIPAGFGFSRPVAPNTTAANKALNRRIEFTVE